MAEGMELLHLLGNGVFAAAALGLAWLLSRRTMDAAKTDTAYALARTGAWVQGLHLVEHIVLTVTLFVTGRSLGLSTWFGTFEGTASATQRVWWHGTVNVVASAFVFAAVAVAFSGFEKRRFARSTTTRPALLGVIALVLVMPTTLAMTTNRAQTPHGQMMTADTGESLSDVATAVGLDVVHSAFRWDVSGDPIAMMSGGLCWIDVDRDGWLDLFVTDTWSDGEWALWNESGGLPTTRIFRNAEGNFVEATAEWNAGHEARALGCTVTDFNSDGFADLYVTTSRANLLLLNEGGTGFAEVAKVAGADLYGWHAGAAAGDLNGDGHVDLFVAGYADLNSPRGDSDSGFPNTVEARPDVMLFGTGVVDGVPRFERRDETAMGVEPDGPEYGLDVVLLDADDDGDLDVYVANDTQPNRLYRNDLATSGNFVDIAPAAGIDDAGSGMGVAIGDIDRDGRPDLAVTNLAGQGHGVFATNDSPSGWTGSQASPLAALGLAETSWGVSFVDLDSDADLDSIVASGDIPIVSASEPRPISIFMADGSVPPDLQLPSRNGRGIAPADFDNDGDVDIAISGIGEPLILLENRWEQGRSLTVDAGLLPTGSSLRVELTDGTSLSWVAVSGGRWMSGADPRPHIGIGSASVSEIELMVPGERPQQLDVPPSGHGVVNVD